MTSFILRNPQIRQNAMRAVSEAPDNWIVTVAERKRSSLANAKMWAMLSDVARAKPEGRNWTPETFKAAFMHHLGHQVMFAEGLENSGPFPLGFRSSNLNVKQMSDLIECIYAYGSQHGVVWTESDKGGFMDLKERAGE